MLKNSNQSNSLFFIYSLYLAVSFNQEPNGIDFYSTSISPGVNIYIKKPGELIYDTRKNNGLKDKFFPIGWSRDGKFAYVVEPADEACGCYFFNIVVQNMVTDKISWKWEYNGDDNSMNLDKIWQANIKMFSDSLNFYRIQSQSFPSLKKLPVKINNELYDFALANDTRLDPDFNIAMIRSVTVTLKVNGKPKKVIFKTDYESHVLSNAIKGYLKSPYENRVAVLYIKEARGWEGPPHVLSFSLIGCKPGK